jgi:hypothetical protein
MVAQLKLPCGPSASRAGKSKLPTYAQAYPQKLHKQGRLVQMKIDIAPNRTLRKQI